MRRRPWPLLVPVALLAVGASCSGGDDDDDTTPTASTSVAASVLASGASTVPPTRAPVSTAPAPAATPSPSLTSPVSVLPDTQALGGSTVSRVDLATGAATVVGSVGTEVGVLGIAVAADGRVDAVTDVPALLVLDLDALDAAGDGTIIDAGGDTLLALARRSGDGALFAVGSGGTVYGLDPATGVATPIAAVALDDPGVGLDVTADGTLEVVVATGGRSAVDPATGEVTALADLTADEAPPRVVAVAHDATRRYGIDADTDELVTIADDGTVDTIGPLGVDVTDGASLDIGPDGTALLANPG